MCSVTGGTHAGRFQCCVLSVAGFTPSCTVEGIAWGRGQLPQHTAQHSPWQTPGDAAGQRGWFSGTSVWWGSASIPHRNRLHPSGFPGAHQQPPSESFQCEPEVTTAAHTGHLLLSAQIRFLWPSQTETVCSKSPGCTTSLPWFCTPRLSSHCLMSELCSYVSSY